MSIHKQVKEKPHRTRRTRIKEGRAKRHRRRFYENGRARVGGKHRGGYVRKDVASDPEHNILHETLA